MDLVKLTATLKEAIEAAKEIGSLTKGAKDHRLNECVLDLQGRLIAVQGLVLELSSENSSLVRKIDDLESAARLAGDMNYDAQGGVYWLTRDGKRDGPFCPFCWDKLRKAVHVPGLGFGGGRTCPVCHAHV